MPKTEGAHEENLQKSPEEEGEQKKKRKMYSIFP